MRNNIVLILMLVIPTLVTSQDVEMDLVNANEEFKWGVKFYNQGLYEKSVFFFF